MAHQRVAVHAGFYPFSCVDHAGHQLPNALRILLMRPVQAAYIHVEIPASQLVRCPLVNS